jgi:hypothetical protein
MVSQCAAESSGGMKKMDLTSVIDLITYTTLPINLDFVARKSSIFRHVKEFMQDILKLGLKETPQRILK